MKLSQWSSNFSWFSTTCRCVVCIDPASLCETVEIIHTHKHMVSSYIVVILISKIDNINMFISSHIHNTQLSDTDIAVNNLITFTHHSFKVSPIYYPTYWRRSFASVILIQMHEHITCSECFMQKLLQNLTQMVDRQSAGFQFAQALHQLISFGFDWRCLLLWGPKKQV